ncbi:MAG: CRISPR-associated protein Csx14 [Candidatus Altiarchaeales archaeon WOR_SM1_79]|nr:MAG: CRISPR-associated protein Csx14 [Candidatus Altiarchaeales archaeon WOR_SM1_79]
MNVLITTLGGSPAVVTETIDAFKKKNISIEKVVVVCTNNKYVLRGFEDLKKHLKEDYTPPIEYSNPMYIESDDIRTPEDNQEFMDKLYEAIEKEKREGNDIYLSIAGGRKTMSALAALAGQLHGVSKVYHVIINDPDIESEVIKNKEFHPDPKYLTLIRFPPVPIDISQLTQDVKKMEELRETLPRASYEAVEKIKKANKEFFDKLERSKKYMAVVSICSVIAIAILHTFLAKFVEELEGIIVMVILCIAMISVGYLATKSNV